jgi:hypothetical protein
MKYMRDCAEHQPEIDPRHRENRYSRWLWQRPNYSKLTKKTKIDHGDLETVKWPSTGCKVHIFAQNKV